MFKISSRNIFVLLALSFALSAIDLSAQTRDGRADEPSVGGSSKKAGKTRTYKKARVLQNSTAKKLLRLLRRLKDKKLSKYQIQKTKVSL